MVECQVNKTNEEVTPLMHALQTGDVASAESLLVSGADLGASDNQGASALHYAAKTGEARIVELLLARKAPMSDVVCPAGTPLHWAIPTGEMSIIALLLDLRPTLVHTPDAAGSTPLHTTITAGQPDLTLFLLERGVDPNAKNAAGDAPLHVATASNALEAVRHLLSYGAALIPDAAGRTPLQLACEPSHVAVLKELQRKTDGHYDLTEEKRSQNAEKFKAQGNKVFQAGEYSKSAKFYTLAISYNPKSAALFSNRSAAYYNLRRLHHALADGAHCTTLQPDWPKGYFRKGATLVLLDRFAEARTTFEAGLRLDPKNADLKAALAELEKTVAKRGL